MKRKKFVKMLMAHGIGRNAANAAAWLAVNDLRVPYFKALGDFLNILSFVRTYHMEATEITQPGNCWLRYGWEWVE